MLANLALDYEILLSPLWYLTTPAAAGTSPDTAGHTCSSRAISVRIIAMAPSSPVHADSSSERGGDEKMDELDDANNETCQSPKFHVNVRVLAEDNTSTTTKKGELPPLYEAVIRKSVIKYVDDATRKILSEAKKKGGRRQSSSPQPPDPDEGAAGIKEWCHLIHFQGWNSRWDRWMTETELFHDTPENRTRVGTAAEKEEEEEEEQTPVKKRTPQKKKTPAKKTKKRRRTEEVADSDDNSEEEEDDDESADGDIIQQNLQLIAEACELPFTLQTILVDDNDKITKRVYPPPSFNYSDNSIESSSRQKGITMLHVLPSAMNITEVLGEYVRIKKGEDKQQKAEDADNNDGSQNANETKEDETKDGKVLSKEIRKQRNKKRRKFAVSIIALVDFALPLFLLYKEEREQFTKFMKGGDSNVADDEGDDTTRKLRPSEIYGAEHLLRFFVKLPYILSQYDPPKEKAPFGVPQSSYILESKEKSQEFADRISELIVFLQNNLECFKGEYFAVSEPAK